jgi:hypothetical protein
VTRFSAADPTSSQLVRVEYRLILPNNRLVFVHYLSREAIAAPPMAVKAAVPTMNHPDPRVLASMSRPPIRSPILSTNMQGIRPALGLKQQQQFSARKISVVQTQPTSVRHAGEDLVDLINGMGDGSMLIIRFL